MNAPHFQSPPTTGEPRSEPPPSVSAEGIDLKLRRAELEQELGALTKKGKSYGSELWRDSQHLIGHGVDYAKAVLTVTKDRANTYAQKALGRDKTSAN